MDRNENHTSVALVTGAAGSICKPLCIALASNNVTVIMAGRLPKITSAVEEVIKKTGNKNVFALELDLASLSSVRRAATNFKNQFSRLDILVNGAAAFSKARKTTKDGFEQTFGVCHLGHFLLTELLSDHLKKTTNSRVIVMTMDTKMQLPFENLQLIKGYSRLKALNVSKACNTVFAFDLAERLYPAGVSVFAVNPELTKSSLPAEAPFPLRMIFSLFGASPEKSKDYVLRLAIDPQFNGKTKLYMKKNKEKAFPDIYRDKKVRDRLWQMSKELVELN